MFLSMDDPIVAQQLNELTYERQDIYDLFMNLKTLEQNCPLAQPSIEGSNTASLYPLGQLDVLPLEIIQNILQLLDLQTLALTQSVNQRSKLLVDSLPQHREIVTYAPNALRAMLSTGLAPHFTINHLYRALRAQECIECGLFGAYLYLLECRRYCWLCLTEASDALPVSTEFAIHSFGLPRSAIRQLPCMKSLPGRYNLDGFYGDTHKRRVALVNPKAAKEAGMKLHGTQEAMEAYANPYAVRRFPRAMDRDRKEGNRNATWLQGVRHMQNPSRVRGPPWSHHGHYEPRRFMAAIPFPTLDLSDGAIEWGLSCKGCRDGPPNDDVSRDWEAMYTKRGYLAHLDQCEWSKHLSASLKTDSSTMSERR